MDAPLPRELRLSVFHGVRHSCSRSRVFEIDRVSIIALQMIPAIILFFGMIFLPESPRWLARQDRWEDCHAVLTLVHGHGDPNSPWVNRELQEIKDMCEFERNNADGKYNYPPAK